MLRKIHTHNVGCLSDFRLDLDDMNLFVGPNGTGKSTVFDVLSALQRFVAGDVPCREAFPHRWLTRWEPGPKSHPPVQAFSLEMEVEGGTFEYVLRVQHDDERTPGRPLARVKWEALDFGGKPLFRFSDGTVSLYDDDHGQGAEYPYNWSASGLAPIERRPGNRLIPLFKERMARFIVVRPSPFAMCADSEGEARALTQTMGNFASWYRHLSQAQQRRSFQFTEKLSDIMEGFYEFQFKEAGEQHRVLYAKFSQPRAEYRLDELSEGQRMLIALHALACFTQDGDYTLCIDEPENFLALPEIQPWVTELYDICMETPTQALVISHHPEFLDYLVSAGCAYWFRRDANGGTVAEHVAPDDDAALPVSELIARGWFRE